MDAATLADTPMNVDPITKARPGPADFAKGINQLHACLESHKTNTDRNFRNIRDDLKAAKTLAAQAAGEVRSLKTSMGLDEGQKPVAGLSSPWMAFRRTALATTTAVTALFVGYKTILVILPALIVLWNSFNAAAHRGLL